mgnify:CR=1 FL=1
MNNESLLLSLGVVRPSAHEAASMFNNVLPDAAPRPDERHRIFDERSTIGLMLGQALNRNAPCKDAVRRLQIEFGETASSSTAAYCKARYRVRPETVRIMSTHLSAAADGLCDTYGFKRILALDATTFQLSDTDANRSEWPYVGGQKPGCGFPVASALMAHSLVGKGSEVLTMASWKAHDFRLYVESFGSFREGDLQVGDRAFCSYTAFALLREVKADGIFRGNEWCRKNLPDDIILGDGDRITVWKKCWSKHSMTVSKERRESFPDELPVRIVTATIHTRGFRDEKILIATSLTDPAKYPKEMILKWYLRRWEIEVSFRDMKTTLRYEFIRGQSPRMVKLEIEILLLAYNLMRYVMARGGKSATRSRFGIASTSAAVRSFLSVIQSVYRAGRSCARAFSRLVKTVISDVLPRRKRRPYVRAVKRRPKPYPLLTKPRGEYAPEEVK